MHIQVITGDAPNGETSRLRHIKGLQDWLGETAKPFMQKPMERSG